MFVLGTGQIMFWDLRAGKFLESTINSNRVAHLKAGRGWVKRDDAFMDRGVYFFQTKKYFYRKNCNKYLAFFHILILIKVFLTPNLGNSYTIQQVELCFIKRTYIFQRTRQSSSVSKFVALLVMPFP